MAIDYVEIRLIHPDFVLGYPNLAPDALSVNITRGKFQQLDSYEPGSATIVLNNYDRKYDPTNTSSPLYGYIKPKMRIEIWVTTSIAISGLIDNWAFNYDVGGESTATIFMTDFTSLFANQYLTAQTFPSELSGARINRILSDVNVSWSTAYGDRLIDPGTQLLDGDSIETNTNVLEYIRRIELSEQGQFYAQSNYSVRFSDNNNALKSTDAIEIFADDGSVNTTGGTSRPSVPYQNLAIDYSTDLMYNRIIANSWTALNTAIIRVEDSISNYSINQLNVDGVLYNSSDKLANLVTYLAAKYAYPRYGFASLTVNVANIKSNLDVFILNTSLNKFAKVIFTPNRTGSAISKFVRIIGIQHDISPNTHMMTFQFENFDALPLVLDDTSYGKLDSNVLGL